MTKATAIRPSRMRYIKLGAGGIWEQECLKKRMIRFGSGSSRPERFTLSTQRKWDELTKSFLAEGKTKSTATRFTNETKLFFEPGKRLVVLELGRAS
jgi:hypothetical protein